MSKQTSSATKTTALANRNTGLALARPSMDAVLAEMGALEMRPFLLAQAAIMKLDPALLDIPENVGELVKAGQYVRHYGMMPGVDMHMQTFNTKVKRMNDAGQEVEVWEKRATLVIGEQAYKKSAQIQANAQRDFIDIETEQLTPDDLDAHVKANFPNVERHLADRGARARVLSASASQLYRNMGRIYDPEWSYGFFFWLGEPKVYDGKKSYPKGDKDRVPNGRSGMDVAIRRAVKAAIMRKYALVPVDKRNEAQRMAQVFDMAAEDAPTDPRSGALMADHRGTDEDALWAVDPTPRSQKPASTEKQESRVTEEGEFRKVAAPGANENNGNGNGRQEPPSESTGHPDDDLDHLFDKGPVDAGDAIRYADLVDKLANGTLTFAQWAKRTHANSNGPATKPMYQFLAGTLDVLVDKKGGHKAILEVLVGRPVASANPPGFDVTSKLLDALVRETTDKDTGEKLASATYRADVAQHIRVIWNHILEAEGQK